MSTTWRFNIPALLQLVIVAEALGLMTRSPSSSPPGRDELHVTSVPPDCLSLIYLNRVCFAAECHQSRMRQLQPASLRLHSDFL